jgi:hypothetical protein
MIYHKSAPTVCITSVSAPLRTSILLLSQVLLSPSSVTVPNAFFVACSSWEDPPDEPLLSELSRYG